MISAIVPSGIFFGFKNGSSLVLAASLISRRKKMPASESMVVWGGIGVLSSHIIMDSGWSRRFSPTPWRSWCTGMEREDNWEEGPIPERSMSRQVSTAPAQRIVSALGVTVSFVPDFRVMFTDLTVLDERLSLLTQAFVRIMRFGRFSAPRRMGWIYATEAELRRPSSGL